MTTGTRAAPASPTSTLHIEHREGLRIVHRMRPRDAWLTLASVVVPVAWTAFWIQSGHDAFGIASVLGMFMSALFVHRSLCAFANRVTIDVDAVELCVRSGPVPSQRRIVLPVATIADVCVDARPLDAAGLGVRHTVSAILKNARRRPLVRRLRPLEAEALETALRSALVQARSAR